MSLSLARALPGSDEQQCALKCLQTARTVSFDETDCSSMIRDVDTGEQGLRGLSTASVRCLTNCLGPLCISLCELPVWRSQENCRILNIFASLQTIPNAKATRGVSDSVRIFKSSVFSMTSGKFLTPQCALL